MAQTRDGWLWLGTASGLYRFDGVRFEKYTGSPGVPVQGDAISNVWAGPDGALWIGYLNGGMSVLRDGRLRHIATTASQPPIGATFMMDADLEGAMWVATTTGLRRYAQGRWQAVGAEAGFPGGHADHVARDHYGQLWASNGSQLYRLDRASGRFVASGAPGPTSNIAEAGDGRVWVGAMGRWRQAEGPYQDRLQPPPASYRRPTGGTDGIFDRDGNLWGLGCPAGLCRLTPDELRAVRGFELGTLARDKLDQPWQLSSLTTNVALEDAEGNVWVGTQAGLERFRHNRLRAARLPDGERYFHIAKDAEQRLWVSTEPGGLVFQLDRDGRPGPAAPVRGGNRPGPAASRRGGNLRQSQALDGSWLAADGYRVVRRGNGARSVAVALPPSPLGGQGPQHVVALCGDAGSIWIALAFRGVYRYADGNWRADTELGLPRGGRYLAMAADGALWLGLRDGRVLRYHQGAARDVTPRGADAVGAITLLDTGHGVVLGGDRGLAVLRQGRFRRLAADGEDALASISGQVVTANGDRWLNGAHGVLHVAAADWAAAQAEGAAPLRHERFDALDGYTGAAMTTVARNSAAEAHGRLWFVTTAGIVSLDPARLMRNTAPPPVLIRGLETAGQPYLPAAPSLTLPPGGGNLRIDYTALSYVMPERVRFRYRLDGVDQDWQEAGTRRAAYYTQLRPGKYRFHVSAINEDGVPSAGAASMDVVLQPTFVQTPLFLLLCVMAGGGLLYALYRLRMEQVTRRYGERLQVRLAERERIARTLHDTLLQSMQGLILRFQSVSRRLPADGEARATMETILDQADGVMVEGRKQIMELRASAYGDNLSQALAEVGQALQETFHTPFRMAVDGELSPLDSAQGEELYHIGREALFNAFQHAGADSVELELVYGCDHFVLYVRDNGRGMSGALRQEGRPGHWGLKGMRERAAAIGASLDLRSQPGRGTEVVLKLPSELAYRPRRRPSWRRRLAAWLGRAEAAG
jgi:signal transduction histidine kinase/ligand-binding sensor domain-containing protein